MAGGSLRTIGFALPISTVRCNPKPSNSPAKTGGEAHVSLESNSEVNCWAHVNLGKDVGVNRRAHVSLWKDVEINRKAHVSLRKGFEVDRWGSREPPEGF